MSMLRLPNDAFFKVREVATFLKVHRVTIYRWIEEGRLEAIKPHGQYLIKRENVLNLLTSSPDQKG